jgi:hypothetical protein
MSAPRIFVPEESKLINRFLILFLLVLQIALFYTLANGPVILQDSEEFLNSSFSFQKDGNFYSGQRNQAADYRLFSKRTPFYPLLISSFQSNHIHLNFIYIVQLFLALFTFFIGFVLLKRVYPNGKIPIINMSVFILFTPSLFIYSQFIMADIWLQFFIMLTAFSYINYVRKKDTIWIIATIIFSTLAALTKPVFLPASFAMAILGGYHLFNSNKKYWIVFCLLPFLSWYGVSNMNKRFTGVFHYSSIGYINLLHYNTNLFLVSKFGNTEAANQLEPLMIVPHNKAEFKMNYREVNTKCREILYQNWFSYSIYHFKGVIYFFLDPGRFDLFNFFKVESTNSQGFLHKGTGIQKMKEIFNTQPAIALTLLFVFIGNLIKSIGFLGFVWINRRNKIILFLAALVFYIAFLTGPLGASRFALPTSLIVIVMASAFYKLKWEARLKNSKVLENQIV